VNKDFDNNIPDFSTRKKVLKLILFLLVLTVFYFLYKSKIFDLEKIVDTFNIICYNVSVK